MKVIRTEIPEVLLLEPKVFEDPRGAVFESYNRRAIQDAAGVDIAVVQENHSHSVRNVVRGLHYQVARPQGKLVSVVRGEIFDVAVDIRRSSPTFGRWVGFTLSEKNARLAWIPPGFAHGLLALSETVDVLYKLTELWSPEHERAIVWNDPSIGVRWPIEGTPILSGKDANAPRLAEAELFA
jgi:dTDP-4-dehydrorhamnose 3,5-epimerase